MYTRLFMLGLAGIFAVACATPYDLKHTTPLVSYTSPKSVNDIKRCIMKKWQSHLPSVTEEKMGDGWLVRYNDVLPAATVAIVTIENLGQSVVNYYNRNHKIRIRRLEEEVQACK